MLVMTQEDVLRLDIAVMHLQLRVESVEVFQDLQNCEVKFGCISDFTQRVELLSDK